MSPFVLLVIQFTQLHHSALVAQCEVEGEQTESNALAHHLNFSLFIRTNLELYAQSREV
jgi:hypothetical protein